MRERIAAVLLMEGYTLLNYVKAKKPMAIRCPGGHEYTAYWFYWRMGRARCNAPYCAHNLERAKLLIKYRTIVECNGQKILNESKINSVDDQVEVECTKSNHKRSLKLENLNKFPSCAGCVLGEDPNTIRSHAKRGPFVKSS